MIYPLPHRHHFAKGSVSKNVATNLCSSVDEDTDYMMMKTLVMHGVLRAEMLGQNLKIRIRKFELGYIPVMFI